MRRRRGRVLSWPRELLAFDAADWPGEPAAAEIEAAGWAPGTQPVPRVMESVAVARWVSARESVRRVAGQRVRVHDDWRPVLAAPGCAGRHRG